ncbi:MAG: choice-of-anchor L domain-containing protein [Bacteroidota bacterium]
MQKATFTCLFLLALAFPCRAQLFVDTQTYTAEELAMDFFNGNCVDVLAADFQGEPMQITFFEGSQSGLNVNAGLILTTGVATLAASPNNQDFASAGFGIATPDTLIAQISQGASYDRAMLHMTIVPHVDSIGFKYVFGSEEFCEYVGSQFNDAFGFWIQGPGFPTPTNIALIPGTTTPVNINNVNHLYNTTYYINNTPDTGQLCFQAASTAFTTNFIQYDGLTTVLTASALVTPNAPYDVWIGVSDIGDGIYDSGVFLSVESLCGDSLLSPDAAFAMNTTGATVQFQNTSKYATHWHWDFGDGTTSEERFPNHDFGSLNQQYKVTLVAMNYCCADTTVSFVGTSAVADPAATLNCKVYPTHFNNQLIVEPADASLQGQILLSDLSGRVVLQHTLNGKTSLETGSLAKGVYFLEIQADGRRSVVQKIVK